VLSGVSYFVFRISECDFDACSGSFLTVIGVPWWWYVRALFRMYCVCLLCVLFCVCVVCVGASTLAQRKRVGLITQRSLDRDQQVLIFMLTPFFRRLVVVVDRGSWIVDGGWWMDHLLSMLFCKRIVLDPADRFRRQTA
jgi:hypothetical protein